MFKPIFIVSTLILFSLYSYADNTTAESNSLNKIPSGTYVKAELLTSIVTTGNESNLIPVKLKITGQMYAPNQYTLNLGDCIVSGNARHDFSSERIMITPYEMSCTKNNNHQVLKVSGWIVGNDNKAGIQSNLDKSNSQSSRLIPENNNHNVTVVFNN